MIVIGAPAEPAMVKEETPTGTQLSHPFPGGASAPVVSLDSGKPEGDLAATSPSIVGLAVPDATVSDEKEYARQRAHFAPMVIRGGIVGDAFARTVAPASEPQPSETASAAAQPAGQGTAEPQAEAAPAPSDMQEQSAPR
jgi:hypothetical protein